MLAEGKRACSFNDARLSKLQYKWMACRQKAHQKDSNSTGRGLTTGWDDAMEHWHGMSKARAHVVCLPAPKVDTLSCPSRRCGKGLQEMADDA